MPLLQVQSLLSLLRMTLVELINQFLCNPEILRMFPANGYITVNGLLYQIMEHPLASLRVEDLVDFPFVRVDDNRSLLFR
jgi:hypothetical protein